jgi:hypothetical protein
MLATYPVEATQENWLSSCLTTALLLRLEQLDAGQDVDQFPTDVDEKYRETIARFTGVVDRFNALSDALAGLSPEQRSAVRDAIETQNRFPEIFDPASDCFVCNDALPEVHALARKLFEFSFGVLSKIKTPGSDVSVRDVHYAIAYDHLLKKCCPFCGLERLEPHHPDIPRPDLDHYLAISQYPFCGVNLRNLTPMGDRCNSSYKLAVDILRDKDGSRLPCYDPYGDVTTGFSLTGSTIIGSPAGEPVWVLQLAPEVPETENWNRIFRIRLRLEQSLKAEFAGWVTEIGGVLRGLGYNLDIIEDVFAGLQRYQAICSMETLPGVALLKAEVASLLFQALGTDGLQERTHAFIKETSAPA